MKNKRLPKGQSYLTHGSDTYNKKGLHKALRHNAKAEINEQLNEEPILHTQPEASGQFVLLVSTQVHENYGYRVKAKGGNDYYIHIGSVAVILGLGPSGIRSLLSVFRNEIESDMTDQLHSQSEWIIDWSIVQENQIPEGAIQLVQNN